MSKPKKVRKKDFERLLREYDFAMMRTVNKEKQRKVRKLLIRCFMDAKGRGKQEAREPFGNW